MVGIGPVAIALAVAFLPTVAPIQGTEPLAHLSGKATVFLFIQSDCPLSNAYAPEINRIYETYAPNQISFASVYEDDGYSAAKATGHARQFGYRFSGYFDSHHALAKRLGAKVTPEAIVVGPSGKILYRGRIDNTYASVAKRRGVTTKKDLREALGSICENRPVSQAETEAIGCSISDEN